MRRWRNRLRAGPTSRGRFKATLLLGLLMPIFLTACSSDQAPLIVLRIETERFSEDDFRSFLQKNIDSDPLFDYPPLALSRLFDDFVKERLLVYAALQSQPTPLDGNIEERYSRERQLVERYISAVVYRSLEVTTEELARYYQEHMERFTQPEGLLLHHYLMPDKAVGEQILSDFRDGKGFEALTSPQAEASVEGERRFFRKGELPASIEDRLYQVQQGEMSDLIQFDGTFHLFFIQEKRQRATVPFEEVQESIYQMLLQAKQREALEAFSAKLKKKHAMVLFYENLWFLYQPVGAEEGAS